MARMQAPGGLLDTSFDTLQIMLKAGARGPALLEQGDCWATWAFGDTENLLIAARGLIEAGYPAVDMRLRRGVRELYVAAS